MTRDRGREGAYTVKNPQPGADIGPVHSALDIFRGIAVTSKRLLIGASSPVGYFYLQAGEKGRPAPILESPLSYLLLYEEVWFLSRQLCPYNMEKLDFVHFVDEELQPEGLPEDAIPKDILREYGPFPWDTWKDVIGSTIGLRWSYDNHARRLKFGELHLLPSPGRYESLLVDRFVATEFGMDLVENTANAVWSQDLDEQTFKTTVSEKLLSSSFTSLQTIDGPWHPAIADLRSDSLLKSYRRRIELVENSTDLLEVDKRLTELSVEFDSVTRKIVEEHYNTSSLGKSTASFLVGLMPAVGNAIGALGLAKEVSDKLIARRNSGWVGFLGRANSKLHNVQQGIQPDGPAVGGPAG